MYSYIFQILVKLTKSEIYKGIREK